MAIIKAGNKCQLCGFRYQLDVHHLSYKNLGNEKDEDLLVVCRRCHNDLHYFENHRDINDEETKKMQLVTETEYKKSFNMKRPR